LLRGLKQLRNIELRLNRKVTKYLRKLKSSLQLGANIEKITKEADEKEEHFDNPNDLHSMVTGNNGQILKPCSGPADSPWHHGAAELMVKTVKKCLQYAVPSQRLTHAEYLTTSYEIDNRSGLRGTKVKVSDS